MPTKLTMTLLLWLGTIGILAGILSAEEHQEIKQDLQLFNESNLAGAIQCLREPRDLVGKEFGNSIFARSGIGSFDDTRKAWKLYIVLSTDSRGSFGRAFNFMLWPKDGCPKIVLVNDVSFRAKDNKVLFVTPPLGGEYTQNELLRMVRTVLKKKAIEFQKESQGYCGVCKTYFTK